MLDLGWEVGLRIWVDSTAAKAVASRVGLGKVRHMEVKYIWVQESLRGRRFQIFKVDGTKNPGDVATKPHSAQDIEVILKTIGIRVL